MWLKAEHLDHRCCCHLVVARRSTERILRAKTRNDYGYCHCNQESLQQAIVSAAQVWVAEDGEVAVQTW